MAPYQLGNINARPLATFFHVKPEAKCFGLYLPERYDIICMCLPHPYGVEPLSALEQFSHDPVSQTAEPGQDDLKPFELSSVAKMFFIG